MPNAAIRSWSIAISVVCAMSAFAAHGDEAKAVQAIWKSQEIKFYYQNTAANFSCDGFKRKLTRILKALGAADSEVLLENAGCDSNAGVARQPLVDIKIRSPVEATPKAIAELAKEPAAAGDNQPFAATWRPVSLSRGRLQLEPTDCALVDHLKQLLLPKLAVRVVDDSLDCLSGAISSGQPRLMVEALVAAS